MSTPNFYFERGSITIPADEWNESTQLYLSHIFKYDQRTNQYRAEARHYAQAMMSLHKNNIAYNDKIKQFKPCDFKFIDNSITPRPYQTEALEKFSAYRSRACIILPTGAGKSFLAMMAIEKVKRDTLILVPTLDLLEQWVESINKTFSIPVGRIGGGIKDIQKITVCTYDSAQLMMEFIGNRFGFLICDECHHLPGPQYQFAAIMCVAPFRLGLTATPERSDGKNEYLKELIGPIAYEQQIQEMSGIYLSDYQTHIIEVPLTEEEEKEYKSERKIYTDFIKKNNLDFSNGTTWIDFISLCFSSEEGKKAFKAHQKQKNILKTSENKLRKLYDLIQENNQHSILIFTDDNKTAYRIGETFALPVITHHTKAKERKEFLEKFKSGEYPILVSSKVLNEGVDVPEANVGIILSGSGSQREHVQRLGRILRKVKNKNAVLYELISKGTSEKWQSRRRREHSAYSQ
jgi:superfamily II DNA or RNA helicase